MAAEGGVGLLVLMALEWKRCIRKGIYNVCGTT
jgi:hypothetical protein